MITDTEIKQRGIKALIADLGNVQAERFISLIIREPFDYQTTINDTIGHITH